MVAQQAYGGYIPLTQQGLGGQSAGRFSSYGRDVPFNPALQRGEGLSEGFGQDYQAALGMQRDMYGQFGQMAAGQGPSLAQAQLQQGMAMASQGATQQMLNARGGNAAGAQMAGASIGASMGGQAAMGAAALRQQEQLAAMQAQAGMASQMAGQGLQGRLGMEGLYQGALGAQLDANLQARGMADARHNQDIERAKGIKSMFLPDLSDVRSKQDIQPTAAATPSATDTMGSVGGLLGGKAGGLLSTLGPLIALSDVRTKTGVEPTSASEVMGQLDPTSFEYKPGFGQPPGRNLGVMAQDLGAAYPPAVGQGPDGLQYIDQAKAGALTLAATAEQEQRIRRLEAALAGMASPLQTAAARPMPSDTLYRIHGTSEPPRAA